jgi:hypothetical protein
MLLTLAWMAKLQFIFGGDYLFRAASLGILISIAISIYDTPKNVQAKPMRHIFMVNLITLLLAYGGMMLKVSHLMHTQLEKDIVLDFIAYPALSFAMLYSFAHSDYLMQQDRSIKIRLMKTVLLPWCVFGFSLILYAVYSATLSHMLITLYGLKQVQ